MKIYGSEQFGNELFMCVTHLEELEYCAQMIPCFEFGKHSVAMVKFCKERDMKTVLIVKNTLDVVYGINLQVDYLLARPPLGEAVLQEWQGILQDYVCDTKLIFEVHGQGKEILNALRLRLDGVVLSSAIKDYAAFCNYSI